MHHSRLKVLLFFLIICFLKGADSLSVIVNADSLIEMSQVKSGINNWRLSAISEGRLNAMLNLRSLERVDSLGQIQIVWDNNHGYGMQVDSVILSGKSDFAPIINEKLADPFKNLPASLQTLAFVQSSLKKYSFLESNEKPYFARYEENQIALLIPIRNVLYNNFSGILGYQPNNQSSGRLTGDISINFTNLFGYCTITKINWKRKDQSSQKFSFQEEVPIIPGTNFGAVLVFQQSLQDGMFIKRQADVAIESYLAKFGTISIGTSQTITSLTDLGYSTGLYPYRNRGVNLRYSIGLKDGVNATGNGFFFNSYLQLGELKRDNNIREFLTVGKFQGQWIRPILENWNFLVRTNFARSMIASGSSIPVAEKFRFGGATSLRGYREDAFVSEWMSIQQFELRYELGQNTRLYTFMDAAISDNTGIPFAIGLGINQPTSLGMFSIDYAVSRDEKPSRGKIHFRIAGKVP